jgi:pyrimidine-specific ribonucleoside hydrolase
MAKTLRESPQPVTIVATGPQTNVALLLNSHPELHAKIARIVIMGGAMVLGNWQPAAEFNIYVDPEAAEIVFQSGIPVVMAGLDVTHRAQIHVEDIERFRQHGNPVSTIVAELLDFFMSIIRMRNGALSARRCTTLHHRLAAEAGDVYHR